MQPTDSQCNSGFLGVQLGKRSCNSARGAATHAQWLQLSSHELQLSPGVATRKPDRPEVGDFFLH